jgi:predicted metalloprotease with PDZ domain
MKQWVFGKVLLFSLVLPLALAHAAGADEEGWLGIEVQELSESLKEALDYGGGGVLVNEVIEESPAAKAGITAGDIITSIGGQEVEGLHEFIDMVRDTEPGTKVKLGVVRKGKQMTLEAEIAAHEPREFLGKIGKHFKGLRVCREACLGVRVEDLGQELGEYFATEDGALVLSVREDCPAAKAGMRPGDVIKEIDGSRIHDADDVFEMLDHKEKGDQVTVTVLRKGKEQSLTVTLGSCEEYGMDWGSHPGEGAFAFRRPGRGCLMLPDRERLESDLRGLEESLESSDLGRDIEREIRIFGDLSEEKLKDLEKNLEALKEEVAKLKEKMAH